MVYDSDLKGVKILPLKMKRCENNPTMVEILIAVSFLILLDNASSQVSLSDNANF